MAVVNLHIPSLSIISITIILAASIVSVALAEFGNFSMAEGQGNNITSSSLTPQQKHTYKHLKMPLLFYYFYQFLSQVIVVTISPIVTITIRAPNGVFTRYYLASGTILYIFPWEYETAYRYPSYGLT
jgi:hypothetical protein